ncbi:ATP-dependent zinc protease [Pseudomonas sp.]|uniref:retropepsin-like aspartic peptidase RloA2 n=1 Tax=Pseudomonas sp. TaxID=306 RepID=UPI003A96E9CE
MKIVIALTAALLALPVMAAEKPAPELNTYGRYEMVTLPQIGQTLKAKMDTGAMTASLSAKDIEQFKRDGGEWVRFRLAIKDADDTVYEQPLARITEIKNRAEEGANVTASSPSTTERPVVNLEICVGHQLRTVEVNLTDRTHFDYPLLIGASAIRKLDAAINPAERYTVERPEC